MDDRSTDPRHLVDDPSFRHYVRRTNPGAVYYWTDWLVKNPNQEPIVREATRLVQRLDAVQRHKLSNPEIAAEVNLVHARLKTNAPVGPVSAKSYNPFRAGRVVYWAAAASVVLISLWGGVWFANKSAGSVFKPVHQPSPVVAATTPQSVGYQTSFGKRRQLTLPDGSVVTLNAHSSLRVLHWTNTRREVLLRGEAFFRVSKKSYAGQSVKFVVRANNVAVEVLGTQFDVSTRNRHVKVVLNEGRIRLKVLDAKQPAAEPIRTLDMLPGDLVELTDEQNLTLSSRVETAEHSAWVSNELIFDETPLGEVAQLIEDNYGCSVQFADPALANRRLTARLPDPSLAILLKALAKAFALSITQTDKTIRIAAAP